MMNDSLKVAQQASSTVLIFLEAIERGRLTFDERYPQGIPQIAASLIDQIMAKLEAPLDRVRLDQIDLDADTENEEQFIQLRDTLCYLLTMIAHRQIVILKSALAKCLDLFAACD